MFVPQQRAEGIPYMFNPARRGNTRHGYDVKTHRHVQPIITHIHIGSPREVAFLLFVNGLNRCTVPFTTTRFHLYHNQFAITFGNDVQFPVSAVPIQIPYGIIVKHQIPGSGLLAHTSQLIMLCHGSKGTKKDRVKPGSQPYLFRKNGIFVANKRR